MEHGDLKKDGRLQEVKWGGGPTGDKIKAFGWSTELGPKGKKALIEKRDLRVDMRYQRGRNTQKAQQIARDFKWSAFGTLIVSNRNEHEYFVIDGGHRALAAMMRPDVRTVPCYVIDGLTREQEAEAFIAINKQRRPMGGIDQYRARLTAKEPIAIAAKAVLDRYAIKIAYGAHAPDHLNAILTALQLEKRGSLCRVLEFIHKVWPEDPRRLGKTTLMGVDGFEQRMKRQLRLDLLAPEVIKRFQSSSLTALLQRAMAIQLGSACSQSMALIEAMVNHWNKGRRSGRINGSRNGGGQADA